MLHKKPDIQYCTGSSLLAEVKRFLPKMADAQSDLKTMRVDGGGEGFGVEDVSGDKQVIEMDIALIKDQTSSVPSPDFLLRPSSTWTSDSEPDSPASINENSFTSDTDLSSTSSSGSSSTEEEDKSPPPQHKGRKRPLIEEVDTGQKDGEKSLASTSGQSS